MSAAVCLGLGWWQWERFEAVGGNGQNLGYAFQWPLFAVFVIYAYRKFVRLEDEDPDEAAAARPDGPTEVPLDLLPKRSAPAADARDLDDPEARQLLEYNSYLAELNESRGTDRSTT
ncbi:transcriptional regulator [Rhodococcus sp. 05-2254-4]|nr:transcriptional regulator [Rhodococcus sp. 05-2254-4]OZE48253.1 transcriptional regulator [Rhodococcus sp. 05-2254-3]OZE49464.1 transcriptional regulator [Rhodococcus sp. 05-2254-2]OZF44824.1 transcriptional regulator [Rhodococcus sp. 14-1411-2a]